jgi:hypothetical protein
MIFFLLISSFFFSFSSLKFLYRLTSLFFDLLSRLGHVKTTLTWFSFKTILGKKLSHEVFYVNFIFLSQFHSQTIFTGSSRCL